MSRFWSPVVQTLSPYVPGEQPRQGGLIKLNTNENPYPPSPLVQAAIAAAAERLRLYPDPRATVLREALAARHGVAAEEVFVGNGSDEVLAHSFPALLKHEAPLLFPDITYSFYPVYCRLYGVAYEEVPLDAAMRVQTADYRRPCSAILLCNPNAPTGIALPRAAIEALERVKDSFNSYPLDCLAIAGAVAAIGDEAWFQETRRRIMASRELLVRGLTDLGFEVLPSQANFIFARHPGHSGAELFAGLRERGVLVRHFRKPRIQDFLRITVGTEDECSRLIALARELV